MTVNEKGLEAAREAIIGNPLSDDQLSRIIKAYLRAASKDAEPMAWIAEAGENKQPCLCWTEAVALSEADGDRSRITPLFTHPSTWVEGVNAVADAWTAITTERNRQISDEGWAAEHDDEHRGGENAQCCCRLHLARHADGNAGWLHARQLAVWLRMVEADGP